MIEQFEAVAKALADTSRIRIVKLLESGEACVCQVTAVLDLAMATVSRHLSVLKAAGLVTSRKDGRWVYYRLAERPANPHALTALALLAGALDDDEAVLADARSLLEVRRIPLDVLCGQGAAHVASPRLAAASRPSSRGADR